MARILGAPDTVPAGKQARITSKASLPFATACRGRSRRCASRGSSARPPSVRETWTLPGSLTRPTSFLPRSTSMMCSARSFGSASSSSASAWSSSSRRAAPPGAGDGPEVDPVAFEPDHDLRRRAHHGRVAAAQKIHVRRRIDQAERPVDLVGFDVDPRSQSAGTARPGRCPPP